MNAEKKREYRAQMSEYQKLKYLEYLRKRYHALSPEKKAAILLNHNQDKLYITTNE